MKPCVLTALFLLYGLQLFAEEPGVRISLWPEGAIPGPLSFADGEERDTTQPDGRLVAGQRVVRLGHVSNPEIEVHLPPEEKANGAAVVICPGGGFSILAWDLEGTEVAQWLNERGIAGIVLKYRVPTGKHGDDPVSSSGEIPMEIPKKSLGPVMDAQRAISLTRSHASEWGLDPSRIGVMGFSAGGETAAFAALAKGSRSYEPLDKVDGASCEAHFALLVYPGGLADNDGALKPYLQVASDTPPMFFAHAADDSVTCLSSTALFNELKKAGVSAEIHVFANGGHGYGLRPTEDPVTGWPALALGWMRSQGFLGERVSD